MTPTFIACAARSGSTLLRWLIDAHPEVACPSETDVALMLGSFDRSANAMSGPHTTTDWVQSRQAVEGLIETYLAKVSKSLWCDKSLSTALNLDFLAKTWPSARFIFLHRHLMDFIASALEAQPWGLSDYGFPPYAAQSPGDNVAALTRCWLDYTNRMLNFERQATHLSVRVRYEDLVASPVETMGGVWDLLGVDPTPGPPDAAFTAEHDSFGCADHTIWYTSGVSTDSVGKGSRIPFDRIPAILHPHVNATLAELGYDPLDSSWGAGGEVPSGGTKGSVDVRVVSGHLALRGQVFPQGFASAVIAVEEAVVDSLIAGTLNIGTAIRTRAVRYYGPTPGSYGEERALFAPLPKMLAEMRA